MHTTPHRRARRFTNPGSIELTEADVPGTCVILTERMGKPITPALARAHHLHRHIDLGRRVARLRLVGQTSQDADDADGVLGRYADPRQPDPSRLPEIRDTLRAVLALLTPLQARIVHARADGSSFREIARAERLHHMAVIRRWREAVVAAEAVINGTHRKA